MTDLEKDARAKIRFSLKKVRFPKFKRPRLMRSLRKALRRRKIRIPKVTVREIYDSEDLYEVVKSIAEMKFMD